MANSFLASFEVNSIGERIGGIDGEIFENWRGRGGLHAATDRTMADNRIASDFCMPISWPVLCRRQCANNYAKRRPFIRPFGRIQTAFPYPLSSRGANNRSDARRFHVFLPFFFSPSFSAPLNYVTCCRWHRLYRWLRIHLALTKFQRRFFFSFREYVRRKGRMILILEFL